MPTRRQGRLNLVTLASILLCMAVAGWREVGSAAEPTRPWVFYLLEQSHVDIGFTDLQPDVERKQMRNLDRALEICRKTADYPPGAQFKWNPEVLWAVDSYLRKAPPEKQQELIEAVQKGWIGLDALYCNELTGLCRPEELLRLCQCSRRVAKRCGVKMETAMITDVPGCTWGIVPALSQAGVKYFSINPNPNNRAGWIVPKSQGKPFYWLGPDGRQKVLCWYGYEGYAWSFANDKLEQDIPDILAHLEAEGYPYDFVQLRLGGENTAPDPALSDAVKNWNAKHASPKLVITTTSEMFRDLKRRYAGQIPEVRGDFTPYWEDGAGSSAHETAINRNAAERLVQAETLFAMLNPTNYPAEQFTDAWRNVLLYDEHTWGANISDSQPDGRFTKSAWKIKQAFALDADRESRKLLGEVLEDRSEPIAAAVDVFNTSCWTRTDLVTLLKETSTAGDVVSDADGQIVPSQRLSTGELVFLAKNVPPLAGCRYTIGPGSAPSTGLARADSSTLTTGTFAVKVDPATGAIASLKTNREEFVDQSADVGLNRYIYLPGGNVKDAQYDRRQQVRILERGPLVAALEITSEAPGCNRLARQVRLIDGLDRVELVSLVDKKAIRAKEGVHFGFGFRVPNAVVRVDTPWAVVRPEADQLPGACKNWFTVQRFVDISNDNAGVTWATIDAPLVELGGLTANLPGTQETPECFLAHIEPSQTLYSWVMNNHWYTNYKADQEGPTTFRYAVRPHAGYDPVAAQRFGIECSQPLVVLPARGAAPRGRPFLELDTPDVIVASIKPSNDRKAMIVRLFGAGGRPEKVTLRWGHGAPAAVWISNLAEEPVAAVAAPIDVPAWGLVTLRAELREQAKSMPDSK